MRVLGVDIKGSDVCWIVLSGSSASGQVEQMPKPRIALPTAEADEIGNLLLLKTLVLTNIRDRNLDCIAVIRAGVDCSVLRAKVECMVQQAAREANIRCILVAPQTVSAAEKRKVTQVAGRPLEDAFGEGQAIQPGYLIKAAYCAWSAINGSVC